MPVFYMLVILAAGLFWLLSAFAYIPLGGLAKRLWQDAKDAMHDNEIKKDKKE